MLQVLGSHVKAAPLGFQASSPRQLFQRLLVLMAHAEDVGAVLLGIGCVTSVTTVHFSETQIPHLQNKMI